MKTITIMLKGQRIVLLVFIASLFLFSTIGFAQNAKEVSLSAYPGFTLVNFEQALGYSDDDLEDWNEFHISAAVRGFMVSEKSLNFGAEVAWQQLYYAYYVISYPAYREFNVTTVSLMALGRYSANKFFVVGGAGVHFFKSGIAPAFCLEAGYMLNSGSDLKFPVSLRVNPILGDGTPIPISIGVGLSYTIR